MSKIRSVQYTHPPHQASTDLKLLSPTQFKKGLATQTEADPVMAKTTKIIRS